MLISNLFHSCHTNCLTVYQVVRLFEYSLHAAVHLNLFHDDVWIHSFWWVVGVVKHVELLVPRDHVGGVLCLQFSCLVGCSVFTALARLATNQRRFNFFFLFFDLLHSFCLGCEILGAGVAWQQIFLDAHWFFWRSLLWIQVWLTCCLNTWFTGRG